MRQKTNAFVRAIVDFAQQRCLINSHSRILVALSGGPDSCALLLSLIRAEEQGMLPRPVGAAHFHHGLRGTDADRDAAFSAALCARFGIPCVIGIGNVPHDAGRSPNDAARRARYTFLEEAARDLGANCIATAHTADDQAETILLRVFRGTGTDGLAGIPPLRDTEDGIKIIRPLLQTRRAEVESFCTTEEVSPRHDPSNKKEQYARARLRKRFQGLSDDFNPRLVESLVRLGEGARLDADLLRIAASDLWARAFVGVGHGTQLRRDALVTAHVALRRRVLLRALTQVYGDMPTVEAALTEAFVMRLETLLINGNGACDLPGGFRATSSVHALHIVPVSRPAFSSLAYEIPLASGLVEIPPPVARCIRLEKMDAETGITYERHASLIAVAFVEGKTPPLIVRSARVGDRIAPLGMHNKTRLVRDIMAEAKWPVSRREVAPLVVRADTGEILWLVGLVQAESTRVTSQSVCVVRLSIFETPSGFLVP